MRQQACGGGVADGRMPYVGMVYNAVPELPEGSPHAPPAKARMQARYLAGFYALPDLGEQMRRQGGQVGMDKAERWSGLTDGGNGLEHFMEVHFPRVEAVILDFCHAADHLGDLARALHPGDEEQSKALKGEWCHIMKHEGGNAIVAALENLALPPRRPAVRAKHAEVLGYLKNNVHRMDYPTYQAKGWLIGSGAVESACKTVVGQRLNWRVSAGVNTARIRSATFALSTKANQNSGAHSGNEALIDSICSVNEKEAHTNLQNTSRMGPPNGSRRLR